MNGTRRLALYISNLDDVGGRMLVALAEGLARRGHNVDLVLARGAGPYQQGTLTGVRVVDLGAQRVRTSVLALARYVPPLVRYLRREHPNGMLSVMNHANVIALAARKCAGIQTRLVVSEHAHLSAALQRTIVALGARRGPIMPWVMRYTYPWADHVVAVSEGVADDLARMIHLARDRVDVIYNPALTPGLHEQADAPLDHPWFQRGAVPVVLAAGRFSAEKNFDALIRAFAKLRKTTPARLIILGEGELRPRLEALADSLGLSGDVALPGFQDNPFQYMRRAALFTLSSNHEGFGNVLIEAMACGTPVVSTDCPSGPAEILEHGKWGRLVKVGDVDALAGAMRATLAETKHPDVAGRAQDFGVEPAVDRYLKLLLGNRDTLSH